MLRRGLAGQIHRLLDDHKVVVLEGGRSVGKTTLARQIAAERGFGSIFDLSDRADLEALGNDPFALLSVAPRPTLIDEAQLSPDITVAVKRIVDASEGTGQFLLTGSARIGRGALGGSDPLAGRAVRVGLGAFTQAELAGTTVSPIDGWFRDGDFEPAVLTETPLDELAQRICRGGLPPHALQRHDEVTAASVGRTVEAYTESVMHLTVGESRTDRAGLMRFFRYVAANPSQIMVTSRVASELALSADTVTRYLSICESSFLLTTVPALRPDEHRTLTSHPRVMPNDTALSVWAASTSPTQLIRNAKLRGALVEAFVFAELAARLDWSETPRRLLHWRDTRRGHEVDLVIRDASGEMVGVEVKSARIVGARDAEGLRVFLGRHPEATLGLVFYSGRYLQQLDDRLWAMPLSSLWTPSTDRPIPR